MNKNTQLSQSILFAESTHGVPRPMHNPKQPKEVRPYLIWLKAHM